jgi:hypothetical protein
VTVDQGQVTDVEQRDLDVLRWQRCELDVSAAGNADEVHTLVQQALQAALDAAEGRTLALRLQLGGATAAHAELQAQQHHWEQEFRALAGGMRGATGNGLWLEKVRFATRAPVSEQDALARDDAIGELLRSIRDLEMDDDGLAALAEELEPLTKKLPDELQQDVEPFQPADPAQIRAALDTVKDLLVDRLLHAGPQP